MCVHNHHPTPCSGFCPHSPGTVQLWLSQLPSLLLASFCRQCMLWGGSRAGTRTGWRLCIAPGLNKWNTGHAKRRRTADLHMVSGKHVPLAQECQSHGQEPGLKGACPQVFWEGWPWGASLPQRQPGAQIQESGFQVVKKCSSTPGCNT